MRKMLFFVVVALMAFAPMVMAQDATQAVTPESGLTPLTVVMKWTPQAQFAGYYAAKALGYYADEGLDPNIIAAQDTNPQIFVASGQAEFGTDWMGNLLATRARGQNVVSIAQVFQRSGIRQLTWKDSGLTTFEQLKGKAVGYWSGGNQFPTFAALTKAGIDINNPDDVTKVDVHFVVDSFLNREVDATPAMTYNELALVLEQADADGKLKYTTDDLNILDYAAYGAAPLEDLIFTNGDWLAQPGHEEIAIKFLRASFRGWIYCRDNPDACVTDVVTAYPSLLQGHQAWMMNEVNKLVWPSPDGIGITDADAFANTAQIAAKYFIDDDGKLVFSDVPQGDGVSYRNDLAQAALDSLQADMPTLDVKGADWKAPTVAITPGGK